MKKIDELKYAVNWISIKASWFDHQIDPKKRKIIQIGYKGFNLYINLFRFLVMNQDKKYTFITSVDFLRKVTGYSGEDVLSLLKQLCSSKIIEIINVSKWTYMTDENGNIKADKSLVIQAIDVPSFTVTKDESGKKRKPTTVDDFWIDIHLPMFEAYKAVGLSERCYLLYCLIRKLSNNMEGRAWMQIEKMADTIGMHKDTVHKLIYEMIRNYFLYTVKRNNKKDGKRFEHKICKRIEDYPKFVEQFKDKTDILMSKWDKKQERNKRKNNKSSDASAVVSDDGFYEEVEDDGNDTVESETEVIEEIQEDEVASEYDEPKDEQNKPFNLSSFLENLKNKEKQANDTPF